MKVSEVMSKVAYTSHPWETLNEAARWMWEKDCGVVPVVDEAEHVVGMLTDRDICMAAYTTGRALADLKVESAMSRRLVACLADHSLEAAADLMAQNKVRRLPVLDADGKLQGVLSLNDLARAPERMGSGQRRAILEKVAQSLASICEHAAVPSVRTAVVSAAQSAGEVAVVHPQRPSTAARPAEVQGVAGG
jgi:CBS-domain-containing membrane protein